MMADSVKQRHVHHREKKEGADHDDMTSSLLHKTRSNQVSYIDVETTKDSFSDGTCSESGEPPGEEGGCQNCGKLVLTMGGVGLCGAVFGIAMEKSRGRGVSLSPCEYVYIVSEHWGMLIN